MEQCLNCKNRLFFVPLPDEVFSCCQAYGETVEDIDLGKGVSPAVEKHGLNGELCDNFGPGESICMPSEENPFELSPIRIRGENCLRERMGVSNR